MTTTTETTATFTTTEGAPVPDQLVLALFGITTAMERLQPELGNREDFDCMANLSLAAHLLAKQLAERLT